MKREDEKYIVVTGGAGFIGSNVIKELNRRKKTKLVVIDNLGTSCKWQNLVGKQFYEILHKSQTFDWLQGKEAAIEAILHLGACSSTVEQDASYLLENNYHFTRRLIEYALAHGIRLVYASSAATYGDGSLGFSDNPDILEKLRPLNMYGYSKHLVDLWLHREKLLDSVAGIKYFNVFGPNEWHKGRMASAICHLLPQARDIGAVELFDSGSSSSLPGEQCRDFIYVKDAAIMTCDLLFSSACGLFNMGSGKASSWNELAKALFFALGKDPVIRYVPMPADLVGKYQEYTCADMTRFSKSVGQPTLSTLSEAVKDYVLFHLSTGVRA